MYCFTLNRHPSRPRYEVSQLSLFLPAFSPIFAVRLTTGRTVGVWKPTAWISRRQSMCETIHLPRLLAIAISLQHGFQPRILRAMAVSQREKLLDGIVVGDVLFP